MKFEQHGVYRVEIIKNIMIVDGSGPFNDETLKHYSDDVKKVVNHLAGSQWGQVVVLHGLSLFTPEAEKTLFDVTCWRKARGLTASAVVLIDPQGEELIRAQLSGVYKRAGLTHAFFDDVEKATDWLDTEL